MWRLERIKNLATFYTHSHTRQNKKRWSVFLYGGDGDGTLCAALVGFLVLANKIEMRTGWIFILKQSRRHIYLLKGMGATAHLKAGGREYE